MSEPKATTTEQILDNITSEFKQIKTDLENIKTAISDTGVTVANTTRGLANDINKISSKVEENIKAADVVAGLAGGSVNISNGFMYSASSEVIDHNSIGVIPGLTTYTVPEDKNYLIQWPTKSFMEQTPSDKRNITINFGKRHFGQLCNTSYRMPKYTDLYNNDTTYSLRVNLNDDSIVLKKKADLTEDELTMLDVVGLEDGSDIFECKGTASLPEYTSDFYINGKSPYAAVIKCDQFVVSGNPNIKAVVTDTIIMDEELILRNRAGMGTYGRGNTMGMIGIHGGNTTTAFKIFVPKGKSKFNLINSTLNPDNEYVKNNISKISKYATIADVTYQYYTLIAVDPTEEMTAFLIKEAEKLAKLSVSIISHDYTKYFDYCELAWLQNKDKTFHYMYQQWFDYLKPTEEDYTYYKFSDDVAQNTFRNYSPTTTEYIITLSDAYTLKYANTESGESVYSLGDTNGLYHNKTNTMIIPNKKYTWNFNKAVYCDTDFPFDGSEAGEQCEHTTDDGRNIYSISVYTDLINSPSIYPIIDFYKNNITEIQNADVHFIIEPERGYDADTKTFTTYENLLVQFYLESDYRAQLKSKTSDGSLSDIENLVIVGETKYGRPSKYTKYLPYFYNRSIKTIKGTDITLVPFRLEAKEGKVTGVTNDDVAVPDAPMEIILDGECAISAWKGGLYYDRTGKHHIITPEKGEYNAKYVHILVDETNTIVTSANACRYRLALFTKDKTKRYNYTTKTWEEVASYTGDTATFAELFPEEFAKLTDVTEV
jgi:hypothetical protein